MHNDSFRKSSILIIDDDSSTRLRLRNLLKDHPYVIYESPDAKIAQKMLQRYSINLAVIDRALPDADGIDLIQLAKEDPKTSVIILSVKGKPFDKAMGLELGADDYLSKPFDNTELLARIRNVLRRHPENHNDRSMTKAYDFNGWTLNPEERTFKGPDGIQIDLTSGEFSLLQILCEASGRVLTRDQILDATHGMDHPAFDRSVDVSIRRLRKKLAIYSALPFRIRTIRNIGYSLITIETQMKSSSL